MEGGRRYYYIWHEVGNAAYRRKFTFSIRSVPQKYRRSLTDAQVWAKGYLANKYGVDKSKVVIDEYGQWR